MPLDGCESQFVSVIHQHATYTSSSLSPSAPPSRPNIFCPTHTLKRSKLKAKQNAVYSQKFTSFRRVRWEEISTRRDQHTPGNANKRGEFLWRPRTPTPQNRRSGRSNYAKSSILHIYVSFVRMCPSYEWLLRVGWILWWRIPRVFSLKLVMMILIIINDATAIMGLLKCCGWAVLPTHMFFNIIN